MALLRVKKFERADRENKLMSKDKDALFVTLTAYLDSEVVSN